MTVKSKASFAPTPAQGPATIDQLHTEPRIVRILHGLGQRSVVLVGMMGAGKTTVGRRLAANLGLDFVDADSEIELAAGMGIPDIFARHGEAAFRDGERKIIARLLAEGQKVLATGGGAYMNAQTREAIAIGAVAVWLRADFDVLINRVRKRSNRPLLQTADPEAALQRLIDERYPVYAQAHVTVQSSDIPHTQVVEHVLHALDAWMGETGSAALEVTQEFSQASQSSDSLQKAAAP